MTRFVIRLAMITGALLAFTAAPALAYQESQPASSGAVVETTSTPDFACPVCHGLESGATSPTVSGTRKGPHGGYTSGTQKCSSCHTVHDATGPLLLLGPTVQATCETCHDGTGGGGVYGVINYRTGAPPAAEHSLDASSVSNGLVSVPGGDPATGGSIETTYSGEGGGLTCTDCHSPHDSNTVAPFVGDRQRSIVDTTQALPSDRLLRRLPTTHRSGVSPVAEYGSDWCEVCHPGRHDAGAMNNHPAADSQSAPGWYYRKVEVLSGYNTSTRSSTPTDLGGSNLGYVIPEPRGEQPYPICQQCHEDARHVGNVTQFQVDSTEESFTVNADGVGGGNPRFQNFPHESTNPDFLIETEDSLCLNCHSVVPNP